MHLRVASANVQVRLPWTAARACLDPLIEERIELIALQEWSPARAPVLRASGSVRLTPGPMRLPGGDLYTWVQTIGDSTIGVRNDRFAFEGARPLLLSGFSRGESPSRPLGVEPAQYGLVVRCRDRASGAAISMIGYHLIAGVESGDRLRTDRPRLMARHHREVARIESAIATEQAAGRTVYAAGDSNVAGLALRGLTSVWADQPPGPGTAGRRRIDDIFGPGPAESVRLLDNPSDHRALIATYDAEHTN